MKPLVSHAEQHSTLGPFVRDAVIGMSDGLTVPFAIAAGLASVGSSAGNIIIAAVLAEIAAGSISMGVGGYLASQTDTEHYDAERKREEDEVEHKREVEEAETHAIFQSYGLAEGESRALVTTLAKRKKDWVDFMMKFELGLERPDRRQSFRTAATIGTAYAVGGLIPLSPYFLFKDISEAFTASVIATALALAVFGYLRGKLVAGRPWRSAFQTVFVGAIAAGAAYVIANLVS
jgi:VIT1/CCC1 family predicted Fe2+/Mn2+ transporter